MPEGPWRIEGPSRIEGLKLESSNPRRREGAGVSLFKLPWKEILKYTPVLIEMATSVKENLGRRESPQAKASEASMAELTKRLGTLERSALEQAELLSKLAAQLETLSGALRVVSIRATVAAGLSVAAVLIAIAGLFVR
jgi:hypothetical protein